MSNQLIQKAFFQKILKSTVNLIKLKNLKFRENRI